MAHAAAVPLVGDDCEITGLAMDSRQVGAGQLFVAIPGSRFDGMHFVRDALSRGAAAVCATSPVPGVATLVTRDPRATLPELAAAFYGRPADAMTLIGITGSLGKTSTTLLVEAALAASGLHIGVIGSLGIRFAGQVRETGMTTPEAPHIHGALDDMRAHGITRAVVEVTSHGILMHRVAGLLFALGILTNIVPDEHLEFHPSPEHYVRTKTEFFTMLREEAPLVVNLDDPIAREVTQAIQRTSVGTTLLGHPDAAVAADRITLGAEGSHFSLHIRRPLSRLDGEVLAPMVLPLTLSILGRQQVANATLAAVAALIAGAHPDAVARAFASLTPMRRRMQVLYDRGPTILDDTVGNPASAHAVFDLARHFPHDRLHVVYAIRGGRGVTINHRNAAALAEGLADSGAHLVVTASEDTAGPYDRVADAERDVVLDTLRRAEMPVHFEPRLDAAVRRALAAAGRGDLVLLLGAQGMDRGAECAWRVLEERGATDE